MKQGDDDETFSLTYGFDALAERSKALASGASS